MRSTSRENDFKLSHAFLLAIAVISSLGVVLGMEETCKNNPDINNLCSKHETCDACIQAHPCCNFCYDEDYKGLKCNNIFARLSETHKCPDDKIEKNFESNCKVSENKSFTDTTDFADMENIVQIKPQKFEIKLRRGEALNITFEYKPVADYPLELYFLADLSRSMLPSLEYMKKLGHDLPDTLKSLSKNYRIAYGSFMDKPGMPFYYTDEQSFMNPCFMTPGISSCEMGYLFRHRLNFTEDTNEFDVKIQDSQVTANIDDLDGALDAILQILVCGKKIGWSENSRKMILLATDSLLHMAGDGILLGAVERPTEKCLLDDNGNHTQPFKYDYPTMEQIVTILKQKKVNIIFAVESKNKTDYYKVMSQSLVKDYGFVGRLEKESENILDLIKQGYNNFAEQVSFFVNLTNHDHLEVKFLADCDNTGYNETSTCYGVKNQTINFIAEIRFKNDGIVNDRDSDTIYIEEKNIDETIEISISYVGNCKCESLSQLRLNCNHGRERCGQCSCDSEWTGEHCDRTCTDDDLRRCRKEENGTFSYICSKNGECNCGKCQCSEPYSGTYCEFKCPSVGGKICNGHGTCEDGKCFCTKEYQGESCSCSKAMYNCDFDGKICSGQGECHCNECKCDAEFSGKYCELSNRNNTICDDYKKFLADIENDETNRMKRHGNYDVQAVEKTSLEDNEGQPICEEVFFNGNYRCKYRFSYSKDNTIILLPYTRICTMTAGFEGAISAVVIIVLTVLAGLAGIMFHKWRIHRQDLLEYKKFLENQGNCSESNPLYLSPISNYENPQRR